MKKLTLWLLSAALCAGLTACASAPAQNAQDNAAVSVPSDGETVYGEASAARAAEAWEAAYQEKIDELEASGGEVHWVIFPCGAGEKILTVASAVYGEGETMAADVYQYADGETKFIAFVSSTGTAYPLAFTEEAILFGGNHTSGKLVINNGAGELWQIKDMNIEGRTPVLEVYDMLDGEAALKSSQELSAEEADAMDFYTGAFADETAEVIGFQ